MSVESIKDYFVSMEHTDGSWVISVKFKENWSGYSSDNGKINAIEDDSDKCLWWYYSKDTDSGIDDICALIKETIDLNMEMEKKANLFTEKAKQLRSIFSDSKYTYEELTRLYFGFSDKKEEEIPIETKKKPKRKKDVIKDLASTVTVEEKPLEKEEKMPETPVNATELTEEQINDLRG